MATQSIFLPGKSYGHRSLVGTTVYGITRSLDTTEQLSWPWSWVRQCLLMTKDIPRCKCVVSCLILWWLWQVPIIYLSAEEADARVKWVSSTIKEDNWNWAFLQSTGCVLNLPELLLAEGPMGWDRKRHPGHEHGENRHEETDIPWTSRPSATLAMGSSRVHRLLGVVFTVGPDSWFWQHCPSVSCQCQFFFF